MRRFYFVYYIILLYSLKIQPVRSVSVVYNVLNVAIAKLFIKPNMLGRYIRHVKAARLSIIIGKVYQRGILRKQIWSISTGIFPAADNSPFS